MGSLINSRHVWSGNHTLDVGFLLQGFVNITEHIINTSCTISNRIQANNTDPVDTTRAKMIQYEIIGDIHGHADRLEGLLLKLGYTMRNQHT